MCQPQVMADDVHRLAKRLCRFPAVCRTSLIRNQTPSGVILLVCDSTENPHPFRRRKWRIATETSLHSMDIFAMALCAQYGSNIAIDLVQMREVVASEHSQHQRQ